jgi:Cytochrome C biogenesis protein
VKPRVALGAGLLLGFLLLGAGQPTFQEVEESLTCQCGCGLTVHSCNHLQCGSALPLREEIRTQLGEGKDKDGIIDWFKAKYGEKILSSPTTTGFNLAAWITPFLAVGIGIGLVFFTIRRWGGRGGRGGGGDGDGSTKPSVPKEYQRILERELEQFNK